MPTDETTPAESTTRRRVFALLVALLAALFGAKLGSSGTFDPSPPADDGGFDLSIGFSVTPDPSPVTPTPTPTDSPSVRAADGTRSRHPPANDGPTRDRAGGDSSGGAQTPGPTAITGATPPVTVSNLQPGDGGSATATLSLSGEPARFWVRGEVTAADERGLSEPELVAGDDDATGELQRYVGVTLRYDAGGESGVVYDGPLADLPAAWAPLSATCFAPGTHTLTLGWHVADDAPNTIQTDAATFTLGVAAEAC